MKIYTLIIACFAAFVSYSNDTIFTSSFEQAVAVEWADTLSAGMTKFERNATSKYDGNFGLQMVFNAAGQKGNLITPKVIKWESGQTYQISFWYKGVVPSDNSATNIKLFANDGTKLGQINLDNWNKSVWTKYTAEFIPSINDSLGYILYSFRPTNSGAGEYYLDDFIVEKVVRQPNFWNDLKTKKMDSDSTIKWVQFGPGMSGNNKAAIWHPTDPNVLFIAPNMGNSYRTTDKGKTYETILNADESGYKAGQRGPVDFFSIDFSRQNPDFGFCSDERNMGIFVTYNRGGVWENLNEPAFTGKYVSCVTVDPQNDNVWYAGGGQMRNLGNNLFPMALERGTMVHDGSLKKLWKTTDGGKNWTLKTNGLHEKTQFETILVDPVNSEVIYATTNYGFYKSIDGAETWVKKTNGFDYDMMRSMTKHYDTENDVLSLFVICNPMWKAAGSTITNDKGGIFKSTDRGETWEKLEGNLAMDMSHFQGNYDIKKSYYHCAAYVFGMTDDEFIAQYPNLPTKITIRYNTIAVDPNDVNNIYLNNEYSNASRNNFKPGQVWRSKDGGKNWHVCLRNGKAWKVGSDDYNYWVGRDNPMETNITMRYLKEWVDRDVYDRKGCNFVRWNADGTVLHTQMAKISFMSYDKGETWLDIDDEYIDEGTNKYVGAGSSNVPGHGFFQHLDIPNRIYCSAGENSLWVTNDEGSKVRTNAQGAESVRILPDESSLSCYAIHPHDTLKHYALFFRQAKKGKLMMSNDGGETWFEQGTAIPSWDIAAHSGDQSVHQLSLIIDGENPDNMYFCVPKSSREIEYVGNSVTAFGVHKSSDGGKNWKEINLGLPDSKDVTTICFHPGKPSTLYAAVQKSSGGLFKSENYGESWTEVSSTLSISGSQGVNDIHFSRDGKVYITAGAKNGNADSGGVWVSSDNMQNWTQIFDYPWTFRIETANYNPNTILVSTLPNTQIGTINAGTFLSKDGGETWIKFNKGNGQSDRINDIAIDNYNPGKYYVSTYGSGWYVATDPNPGEVTPVEGFSLLQETISIKVNADSLLTPLFEPNYAFNQNVDWISDNSLIASVNEMGVVSGLKMGSTIVRGTSEDGGFNAQVLVNVESLVGIAETKLDGFKVFPNPTKSSLHIRSSQSDLSDSIISVYSLAGQKVLLHKADNEKNSMLSMSHLKSGIYILEIIAADSRYQQQIVKQ